MKYAFITAALAAASLATTVNIDVEGAELSTENNRHNRHHVGRHHRDNNRGRHWWTDIFGRGRNDRNERDGRRGRHHGREDRRPDLDEMLEDLFRVNFECTKEADWSKDEWKQCYRRRAEDINDDLLRRDDEIFNGNDDDDNNDMDEESGRRNRDHGRGRGRNGRNGRNDRNGRNGRNDRNRGDRRNHRYFDDEQVTMDGGRNGRNGRDGRDGRNGGRDEEYQCRIDMQDPLRKDQIARMCCEQENLGRYNQLDQTCNIEGREDKEDFQQCAMEQGAEDADCRRENN